MTGVEIAAIAFAALNGLRLIAYVPQWLAIRRDSGRAESISISAWTLWAASHGSTAVYAQTMGDQLVVAVMTVNALACVAVVALTIAKRRALPMRLPEAVELPPVPLAAIDHGRR